MRVTITQKEEITQEKIGEDKRTIFGKVTPAQTYEQRMHAVYLTVELTEEEKAIIKRYALGSEIVDTVQIDDDPDRFAAYNVRVDMHNEQKNEALRGYDQEAMANLKKPVDYKMEHFLSQPCIKSFHKPMHADAYIKRLKTKVLPLMKGFIDANTRTSSVDTFEL